MTTETKNNGFLRPDAWLTSLIGKNAYHANTGQGAIDNDYLKKLGTSFIDVKIDTRDSEELHKFQQAGFRLADTNVQFTKPNIWTEPQFDANVRHAVASDEEFVRNIASTVFKSNRFLRDPEFTRATASKIKDEWVGNFFKGKRGDAMLIAEYNEQVAGFMILLYDAAKDETIFDLMGVDLKFQGKGLAKQLLKSSETVFNTNMIRVGTQLSNPATIHIYHNLGFIYESANYSLHLHI